MKSSYIKALAAIILVFTCIFVISMPLSGQEEKKSTAASKAPARINKICITFDNLPSERNYERIERFWITDQILDALKKHNVPSAGFVVGESIDADWELLVKWLDEGHTLGFMTYTGQDLDNVPPEIFLDDIKKGKEAIEDLVWSYKQEGRFFRFPYLHYGNLPEIKQTVQDYLDELQIIVAHPTVVTEDFVYNLSLEKIYGSTDTMKFVALRDEYMTHILERLGAAETLGKEIMGRQVRHILQLRANRLNGMFLNFLLTTLEEKGYQFISLKDALKDKVYRKEEAYFGNKGLSYLERIKYSDPDYLPASD
ncbi:MAG: polysaccharide deacetylase family protein [Candidatus Zixiibacteriota bacterium]